jgi:hypothetical protein
MWTSPGLRAAIGDVGFLEPMRFEPKTHLPTLWDVLRLGAVSASSSDDIRLHLYHVSAEEVEDGSNRPTMDGQV